MVLRRVLGGSSFEVDESELDKLEKTASVHLPIVFDSFLLRIGDSAQTLAGLPLEVRFPQ